MSHIIIIGGGMAAISAAQAARTANADATITIFAKEPYLPYQRPMLSKGLATGVDLDKIRIKPANWYADQQIALCTNAAITTIDPIAHTVTGEDGSTTHWDALILATGALAFLPPLDVDAFTLRTYDDLQAIRAALDTAACLTVVGGGVLGLEMAWEARSRLPVTVLEAGPHLLSRQLSATAARRVAAYLAQNSVDVRTNVQSEQIKELSAGVVCVAAGVRADIRLAQAAGLTTGRGIIVDACMATSVAGIFAAGDVAELTGGYTGLLSVANGQGAIAGANAVAFIQGLDMKPYTITPPPAMLKIGDMSLLSVGDFVQGEALIYQDAARYVELHVVQRALVGGILMGDVSKGGKLSVAVSRKTAVQASDALAVLDQL